MCHVQKRNGKCVLHRKERKSESPTGKKLEVCHAQERHRKYVMHRGVTKSACYTEKKKEGCHSRGGTGRVPCIGEE